MNTVIFASDKKYYNYLINVHKELTNRNHNVFFLYTESNTTKFPTNSMDEFNYDCNIDFDFSKGIFSNS